jgi:hypothetical protein
MNFLTYALLETLVPIPACIVREVDQINTEFLGIGKICCRTLSSSEFSDFDKSNKSANTVKSQNNSTKRCRNRQSAVTRALLVSTSGLLYSCTVVYVSMYLIDQKTAGVEILDS